MKSVLSVDVLWKVLFVWIHIHAHANDSLATATEILMDGDLDRNHILNPLPYTYVQPYRNRNVNGRVDDRHPVLDATTTSSHNAVFGGNEFKEASVTGDVPISLPRDFFWGNVSGVSYLTHSLNQHIP